MFESEDFDLDEDFLKDIGAKEEEYYSQKVEPDNDRQSKRRKTEDSNADIFGDITFDDEPDFVKTKTISSSIELTRDNVLSKSSNEILLERFDSQSEISQCKSEKKVFDSKGTKTLPLTPSTDENVEIKRRTMAMDILRKGSTSSDKNQCEEREKSSRSNPLRQISPDGEKNIPTEIDEKRRKAIFEKFKKPASPVSTMRTIAKNSPKFPFRDKRKAGSSRMTLIRKFPGPAGLLPDNPDTSLDNVNFLNHLDAPDKHKNSDNDESEISEYCSQDTERMFTVGAWRLMLDDLPQDYLKGHEIATIKRRARNDPSSGRNTRIPILAGVIQKIDHGIENPRLMLKDVSDSIEGTMHSDIILAHPNIFEPGVVVLLRNAGLLGIEGSQKFLGLQFHVMITLKNVVAVYSEKSRLVTTPFLESSIPDCNVSSNQTSRSIAISQLSHEKNTEETSIEMSYIETDNYDIDDDEDFHFDIGEIEDSQIAPCFSNRMKKDGAEDDETKKDESKWTLGNDEKTDETNVERIEDNAEQSKSEGIIDVRPKNIVPVRSRLLQFRSNDVLTPNINEENNENETSSRTVDSHTPMEISEEKSNSNLGTFEDLMDSDNDTEDEILSQLDVDSIVTSYNMGT